MHRSSTMSIISSDLSLIWMLFLACLCQVQALEVERDQNARVGLNRSAEMATPTPGGPPTTPASGLPPRPSGSIGPGGVGGSARKEKVKDHMHRYQAFHVLRAPASAAFRP